MTCLKLELSNYFCFHLESWMFEVKTDAQEWCRSQPPDKNTSNRVFTSVKSNNCCFACRKLNFTVCIWWTQSKTPPETVFKSLASNLHWNCSLNLSCLSSFSGEDFLDHQVHVWQLRQHLPGKLIYVIAFSKAPLLPCLPLKEESIWLKWVRVGTLTKFFTVKVFKLHILTC